MSVTFVDCVKIFVFKIFSPSGSQVILVFLYQTLWQYSDGNLPNGGVECRWDKQKSRFRTYIWLHCVLWTVPAASEIHLAATDHGEFITLVAGKRPSLLMVGNNDEVYDKKPQRYAEDYVTQWLIWSLSNNNKNLRSMYYFVEANYWRTQSIARPLCNSRATCRYIRYDTIR